MTKHAYNEQHHEGTEVMDNLDELRDAAKMEGSHYDVYEWYGNHFDRATGKPLDYSKIPGISWNIGWTDGEPVDGNAQPERFFIGARMGEVAFDPETQQPVEDGATYNGGSFLFEITSSIAEDLYEMLGNTLRKFKGVDDLAAVFRGALAEALSDEGQDN